ncbi:MAG TPA: Pr6Pr family membrane protein [Acidobacteriaceae bacterium]|nr:Pr6Pr family membrane protein [Acidobacteriaceae bacterium]
MAETSVNAATSLTRPMRSALAVIAAVAWFALVLQLLLMVQQATPGTTLHAVINYFSFFTILTNLLVALCATLPLLAPHSAVGQFFIRPSTQTAIAVYIAIVGITYSLLLRKMWNPQGAQKIADVSLHDVIPVLYVVFWVFLVPKFTLRWSDAVRWLAFPVAYMAYTLARGFVSHWYPYYFIDVDTIGWSRALSHAFGLLVAFLVLGLLFIAIGRWTVRFSPAHASVT